MKLYSVEAGNFKLDGGAMFGVVPKTLWQKTNPADSLNMIDMATRCLLIEQGNSLILIDCGMGNKQSEKYFGHFYLWGDYTLESSLAKHGFSMDDITDVFFTHLHFDHCGGAITWNKEKTFLKPAFKNAKFWTNSNHWDWATHPNIREKASFLPENVMPLKESGQLNFVSLDSLQNGVCKTDFGFEVFVVDGHTEKQMIPIIEFNGNKIAFVADLVPTTGHIPLVYVMGYDTRPLLTMEEKAKFFDLALAQNYLLFFQHDAHHTLCKLKKGEKGAVLDEILDPKDFGIVV
ncbi:MAG: MBL fold metallo-hydrolase [Flavobacteriaceae bacterium]|nr:MAG: MBL fold metallo-hydrolase [Flavobacteriaceae bacterium]